LQEKSCSELFSRFSVVHIQLLFIPGSRAANGPLEEIVLGRLNEVHISSHLFEILNSDLRLLCLLLPLVRLKSMIGMNQPAKEDKKLCCTNRGWNDRDSDDKSHFFYLPSQNRLVFSDPGSSTVGHKRGISEKQADFEKSSIDLDVNWFIEFLALF